MFGFVAAEGPRDRETYYDIFKPSINDQQPQQVKLLFKLPADTELAHDDQFVAACVYEGWIHLNTSVGCRWSEHFAKLQETLGGWLYARKEQQIQELLQNSIHNNKLFSMLFLGLCNSQHMKNKATL